MSISDNDIDSFYPSSVEVKAKPLFQKIDTGIVDGEQWICVQVSTKRGSDVCRWLRENDAVEVTTRWAFDAYFEMPEKLYMMMVLKFQ